MSLKGNLLKIGERINLNKVDWKLFEVNGLHGHGQLSDVDHASPAAGDDLHNGAQHKVDAGEGAGNAISLAQECGQVVGLLHVTISNYLKTLMGCRKFDNLIKCELSKVICKLCIN